MFRLVSYALLCVGCALVQLAHLNFRKQFDVAFHVSTRDRHTDFEEGSALTEGMERPWRVRISMLVRHPKTYFWSFFIIKVAALASLVGEIWLGVHLYSWWPGFFIFVPITVGVDLVAARIYTWSAFAIGALFVAAGLVGIAVR